mgnify:FL=1
MRGDVYRDLERRRDLGALDAVTPDLRPTVAAAGVMGPDPPQGSPLYLTPVQVEVYTPLVYRRQSWPWASYKRLPGPGDICPTVMESYGMAQRFWGGKGGVHGFFRQVGDRFRFLSPEELLVVQGFPWGTPLPCSTEDAWGLIGNAVPPPMAAMGMVAVAAWAGVVSGDVHM